MTRLERGPAVSQSLTAGGKVTKDAPIVTQVSRARSGAALDERAAANRTAGRGRGPRLVELRPYTDADLPLSEALELDPEMMRELGGPADPADIARVHPRRIESAAKGEWYFVIVPDSSGPPAGTIGIWESDLIGPPPIHEIGWMVLPEFQGRRIASDALALILSRARSDRRFKRVHAFPAITNAPSNALCRRAGFTLIEETEVKFRNRPLCVNHWEVDVS
jgi:RimJ/RimL family protein N-acetyltransferase